MMTVEEKKEIIQKIVSAWTGHFDFCQDLISYVKPSVVVDLGVDYGFSTFSFALQKQGMVYGIDLFRGDIHTGFRNESESENFVRTTANRLELNNLQIIKADFNDIAKIWNTDIDILHIDGLHTYEAVKNDYETWQKFVKDDGVILFHDTCIPQFGVRKFFDEITLPKFTFTHSAGLGVVSKNINLLNYFKNKYFHLIEKTSPL